MSQPDEAGSEATVIDDDDGSAGEPQGSDLASGGQLLRSSAIVAVGTGLSRVTGLARTIAQGIVLAAFIGDVYNAANTIPNLLYDLLLGGVLAATLVPVFVDNRAKHDDHATDAVITVLGTALLAVTAVAMLFAPLLGRLLLDSDEEHVLTTALLWMFLPQIFFYGVTTLASGLLNAHRRFAAAAFVPVLNNVIVIAVLAVFSLRVGANPDLDDLSGNTGLLLLLGLGTTAGIAIQAAALVPAVRRAGIRVHWRFDHRNPSVRTVLRLSGWTFGYVAINAVVVGIIIALAGHSDGDGATTAYAYGYQFFQLPYGLLAVSVITAFLPELSRLALDRDLAAFGDRFMQALRLTLLLLVPAAIGMVLLALPLITAVFETVRRAWGHDLSILTSDTLVAFGIGLPSFALYLLVVRAFYAMKDTRTPFLINVVQSLFCLVLALLLQHRGAPGLALAFALSYVVFGFIALWVLHHKVGGLPWAGSLSSFGRILVAAAGSGAAVAATAHLVGSESSGGAILRTVAGVLVGGAVYLGLCALLRVPELRQATGLLRRGG